MSSVVGFLLISAVLAVCSVVAFANPQFWIAILGYNPIGRLARTQKRLFRKSSIYYLGLVWGVASVLFGIAGVIQLIQLLR